MSAYFHNAKQPVIGVFDSGMGGMGILRQIHALAPHLNTIYLADTARVPYGSHSSQTIIEYAKNCVTILNRYESLQYLVVACNTATSVALDSIQKLSRVPVMDVLSQTCETLIQRKVHKIAVLATKRTVLSGAYQKHLASMNFKGQIQSIACPLLVPMIEEGISSGPLAKLIAQHYLKDLNPETQIIALGCTHYLVLAQVIKELVPSIEVIDCGELTAMRLNELYPPIIPVKMGIQCSIMPASPGLFQNASIAMNANSPNDFEFRENNNLLDSHFHENDIVEKAQHHYLVTEDPAGFIRLAKQLYGYDLDEKQVELIQSDA